MILGHSYESIIRNKENNTLKDHTHNWSLQPFGQCYALTFHTTYVERINFMHESCATYSIKVD